MVFRKPEEKSRVRLHLRGEPGGLLCLNHPEMAGIYDGNSTKFDQGEYVRAMEEMYTFMKPA